MANIIDRVYQIIDKEDVSISEFSKRIGVSSGYFSKQKANKANIGSQILEKIVREYPNINPIWLLTGSGEMLLNEDITKLSKYTETSKNEADFDSKIYTWLVFSLYKEHSGSDFSVDSFPRLGNIFNLASGYTELMQQAVETDLYEDFANNRLKESIEVNNKGIVTLSEDVIKIIEKYRERYNELETICLEILKIIQTPSMYREMAEKIKK